MLAVLQRMEGTAVASGLPVAGRSGTLEDAFVGTAMEGRLAAKTGTLGNPPVDLDPPAAKGLAGYLGAALHNAAAYARQEQVAAQLGEAMLSRDVIEQAKGVIVSTHRCTPDEAFSLLVSLSQHGNRKLRDVAQALVDAAGSGLHTAPDDPSEPAV